jgi:integrase
MTRACNLAEEDGRLHHSPHIPMLDEDHVRTGFFEREQYEAVRDHLPAPLRPVIDFAHITGWRVRSEVLSLQWQQVYRQNRTIKLEPGSTKNKKGRTVNYGQHADSSHSPSSRERSRRAPEEGIMCPSVFDRDGFHIKDFRHAWKTATKRAGCPGRTVHDFRRTAVRNLTRAGVEERT